MPALPRTLLWLALYVAAAFLGRFTVVQPQNVGVVWPAAGIALVWLASSNRRLWAVDLILLSASTVIVLALTGGNLMMCVLSLATVVQALLILWMMRRWTPQLWGGGGRASISRLGEFGLLLLFIAAATLAVAVFRGAVDLAFSTDTAFRDQVSRWGRHASALATIGIFGLLLGGWIAERNDRDEAWFARPSRGDLLNVLGITVVTVGIFLVGFAWNPVAPSTFMLTLTVVWAAVRFNVVVTAAQCLITGGAAVVMTISGYGPIASIDDPIGQAVIAQIFVVVLMVIGMTIALTRQQFYATIGQLERSEEVLRLRANELDMVMSHLDDAVAIIEEGGRVLHANEALLTAFGSKPAEPLERVPEPGEEKGQSFKPDGQPLTDEENPLNRALAGEVVEAEEIHSIDEHGVRRVLEVSAFQVPSEDDAPKRVMIVIRDITAVSAHRDSLTSFAGTVAHDLNNPLSVIDGWAEALEEDLGESEAADALAAVPMVQHIRASVDQMRSFVSDLLAHAVSRDQSLHCEVVPLRNLVKHIAATRDRPRNGGDIVAEGELLDVWVDRVLLRQVLDNLIGNAFKYVAPGVVPRVVIDAQRENEGWARVRVRDNGIGIPASQRERVFDSFHRVSGEQYQGTGLGLAICKRVIQRHGGTIVITDNPDGQGTCFEFTLPTTAEALTRATMV